MKHSTELFPDIRQLLDEIKASPADIGQIAITAGPGSFTGLRIAVTVAKMMNFAHNTRIIAADTMDVLSENAPPERIHHNMGHDRPVDGLATILDAKRDLFYAGLFEPAEDGIWTRIGQTQLVTANDLMNQIKKAQKTNVAFLGEGLVYYADKFKSPVSTILDEKCWPATAEGLCKTAQKMAQKQQFADPNTLTPFYIRRPEAVENWEKRNQQPPETPMPG